MVRLRIGKPRRNRKKGSRKARSNPIRTVGAVVINPRVRRNRRSRKLKTNRRRRANPVVVNRRRRVARRRTNPHRRVMRNRRRRYTARRRNPVVVNRRRRASRRRSNPRRRVMRNRRTRRNPVRRVSAPRLHYRKNPRRRRARRNPRRSYGMVRRNPMSNIPVIGSALGFLAPAAFGAISVIPTQYAVGLMERWMPSMRADLAFAVSGVVLGSLVQAFGGKIPVVKNYKTQLAVALASAGGAVAAYKYMTGAGGGTVAAEKAKAGFYGGPSFAAPWAGVEGLGDTGYIVRPMQPNSYAGGDISGMYGDADMMDVQAMGSYGLVMTPGEQSAALSGPRAWVASFPAPVRRFSPGRRAPGQLSPHAGQEGHRWGWLIKAVGFEQFQRFAQLSPDQQEAAIRKLLPQFQLSADAVLDQMTPMAGFVYGD